MAKSLTDLIKEKYPNENIYTEVKPDQTGLEQRDWTMTARFIPLKAGNYLNETVQNAASNAARWFNNVNPEGAQDLPVLPKLNTSKNIKTGSAFWDEAAPLAGEMALWGLADVATGWIPGVGEAALANTGIAAGRGVRLLSTALRGAASGGAVGALTAYSQDKPFEQIRNQALETAAWGAGGSAVGELLSGALKGARAARLTEEGAAAEIQLTRMASRNSDSLAFTGRTLDDLITSPTRELRQSAADALQESVNAARLVRESPVAAETLLNNAERIGTKELHVATNLIDNLISSGQNKKAAEVASKVFESAKMPLEQERLVQIFTKLKGEALDELAKKVIKKSGGDPAQHYSSALKQKIHDMAKTIEKMEYGYNRSVATGQLINTMVEELPQDALKQLMVGRKLGLLSGTATAISNISGNLSSAVADAVSYIPSVIADNVVSLFTGNRSAMLPKAAQTLAGANIGARQALASWMKNVKFGNEAMELSQNALFQNIVGKTFEKAVKFGTNVADEVFYKSKFTQVADELMRLNKTKHLTPEIMETAHFEALRATFNNETKMGNILEGLRKNLNKVSTLGKTTAYGAGDFILPFVRTPVNIAKTVFVDFTPLGLFNAASEIVKGMVGKPFNQRAMVQSIGKAATGSSLIGLGWFLAGAGIIKGGASWDSTLSPIENQQGMGASTINLSALRRFVFSGFTDYEATKPQKGDKIWTYDWLQPMSSLVGMGAGAQAEAKKAKDGLTMMGMIQAISTGALGTFSDDTVFGRFFNTFGIDLANLGEEKPDIGTAFYKLLAGIPASFIPSFVNQIRKAEDNNRRKTFDKDLITYATNLMKNKIPGLSRTLDENYTNFGEVMTYYPESTNRYLNILLNPAAINEYNLGEAQEFLMGVYEKLPPIEYKTEEEKRDAKLIKEFYKAMGKTPPSEPDQPRYNVIPYKTATIRNPDGKSPPVELTTKEKIALQQDINARVIANINALLVDKGFKKANENKQLEMIKGQVKAAGLDAEKAEQIRKFGYAYTSKGNTTKKTKKYSSRVAYTKFSMPKISSVKLSSYGKTDSKTGLQQRLR